MFLAKSESKCVTKVKPHPNIPSCRFPDFHQPLRVRGHSQAPEAHIQAMDLKQARLWHIAFFNIMHFVENVSRKQNINFLTLHVSLKLDNVQLE